MRLRPLRRFLALGALALALAAPGQAATDRVNKSAPATLITGCGSFGNHSAPGSPWWHFPGMTINWVIDINLGRPTPVTGGELLDILEDDGIELLCDPATMTLPPGAVLLECDPGAGPPADGRFRVGNITVPANQPVTISFQSRILPATRAGAGIYNIASFYSTPTGTLWSGDPDRLPGSSTYVELIDPGQLPMPLTTAKDVTDVDGGALLPGDILHYRLRVAEKGCGLGPQDLPLDLTDPLPPSVIFRGFTRCDAGNQGGGALVCSYEPPPLHRVHVDAPVPFRDLWYGDIQFDVQVDPATPRGTNVCNQSSTDGYELSDDIDDPVPDNPTCIRVLPGPVMLLEMSKSMIEDGDDDGLFRRGESVRYRIEIHNAGLVGTTDLELTDVLPAGLLDFDPARVEMTPRSGSNFSQAPPAGAGAGVLEWRDIAIPGQGRIVFEIPARIAPGFVGSMCNQATVASALRSVTLVSDDPATSAVGDRTCVPVVPSRLRRGVGGRDAILAACDVRSIGAGSWHSVALKNDGTVSAWGWNSQTQLGDGTARDANLPVLTEAAATVIAISAGAYHTLALRADGSVLAWGDNSWGQLGTGDFTDYAVATPIPGLTGVRGISAGFLHSLAVKTDGSVWAWGYNWRGQLGLGHNLSAPSPVRVPGLNALAVAAGMWHSLAAGSDGRAWAWGENTTGRLGDGTFVDRNAPVQMTGIAGATAVAAGGYHSLVLRGDNTVWCAGPGFQCGLGDFINHETPAQVLGLTTVTRIAAGYYHSLALTSFGDLWLWGDNSQGQIGMGDPVDPQNPPPTNVPVYNRFLGNVVDMGGGWGHSLAVLGDGTVWAWGDDGYGQLGTGETGVNRNVPVRLAGTCSINLVEDPARPLTLADSCPAGGGLGDGYIEPGERVTIDLGFLNEGGIAATGTPDIAVTLLGPPPAGVTYVTDRATLTPVPLPSGAPATLSNPLVIDLDAAIACPRTLALDLQVQAQQASFVIPIPIELVFCAPACQPPADCQTRLGPIPALRMWKSGAAASAEWGIDASALEGYRLYRVDAKSLIPLANLASTARTLECASPTLPSCALLTPIAVPPSLGFHQALSVCGGGLEGPLQ